MAERFVAYYRVSTQQQGRSGLGLDAQREAVAIYLRTVGAGLVSEFTEVETGKGAKALDKRPQLKAALDLCRKERAGLLIAKLDRLARNVHFVSGLLEAGVHFVAADMPTADRTMIQIYSVMAEFEARQISLRTRAALAQAKTRGVRLGTSGPRNLRAHITTQQNASSAFAERLRGVFEGFRLRSLSQRAMAAELNALGIPTATGGRWRLIQVQRVVARLAAKPQA
jgi:DNA invertase Pin-like site-specific DNA recombinase